MALMRSSMKIELDDKENPLIVGFLKPERARVQFPHTGKPSHPIRKTQRRCQFTGPGGEAFTTSEGAVMRILLYNPDNGVTRNFMPHPWMFLLQALTPPGHEVLLIEGNAQRMDEAQIAQFVRERNCGLAGSGAVTRT